MEEYLYDVGILYDCYFTIEEVVTEDHVWNRLSNTSVDWPSDKMSLDEHLAYLSKHVPSFKAIPNTCVPCVFHVVDSRLLALRMYPIQAYVRKFEYRGPLSPLADESPPGVFQKIAEQVPNVKEQKSGTLPLGGGGDYVTEVCISRSPEMMVRDVLTNYLPLAGYCRILWKAHTRPDGSLITYVQFQSPVYVDGWPIARDAPKIDLSTGWDTVESYLKRRRTEVAQICEFIRQKDIPPELASQLRWAMYLLGELRTVDGIPVLLEHIDYQYSPYGVLAESFPAVRALANIGMPAVQAILAALPKEASALRRQLMCSVIYKVHGRYDAVRLVQRALAAADGAKQKANLKAALQWLSSSDLDAKMYALAMRKARQ